MSGICAVWQKAGGDPAARVLSAVTTSLAWAGEAGTRQTCLDGAVGLGVHARFPTQQLFRNHRVVLACDADLLNERDLASGITSTVPRGTAALLAALYERDGQAFVERLRGAFALIAWDTVERRLLAAIDGFGMKRLVWYDDGGTLVISSRVDALRAGVGPLDVNHRAIANVLNFSSDLAPETVFARVQRLMPGTVITASTDGTKTGSYWDMRYGEVRDRDENRLSRAMASVVAESVAAHCAEEPAPRLGAFLSGGTDSSTVVGLMTRSCGAPVQAFSIGFEERGFSELAYAQIAARAFGARHHTYLVSARDCLDAIDRIVRAFDEPFGNSSAIATYFCARVAAEAGVGTLLAGDGGDELFGGNERYATEKIFEPYRSVPRWLRRGVIEPLAAVPIEVALLRRARGYIRRANMAGVERMLSFQFLRTHAPEDVFEREFLRSLDGYSVLDIPARHYADAPASDHLDRLLYVDLKITLADNDLPKVTCMSELAGIRTRFPFLDRSVAEFSGRIPPRLKVKGFQKRYLFKKAFNDLLPADIIQKKKHGFGVPVAPWMRADPHVRQLVRDVLLSKRTFERGYFRRQFIEELFRRHEAGDNTYYGDTLWSFLMLELWLRQVMDAPVRVVA